jgi:hypothetical protein
MLLQTQCLVSWKPEEQPSIMSIINVLWPLMIQSNCSFLHFPIIEECTLLQFHNTVLYVTLCLCLKPLIHLLEAIKYSVPNLVANCRTFPDYCIALCSLFKPLGRQNSQFLKWRLFEALPLTREPATLCITLFGIVPTFISSVQCWQCSSLSVASATHVFLLSSY